MGSCFRVWRGWLFLLALFLAIPLCPPPARAQFWDVIPPADLGKIGLDAFADDELDLPYYVAHFHQLATAVERDDPNRGFIVAPVWRKLEDNKPYNARVMENILSLAFFYTQKRPWNPYYASLQLRFRLEAALNFWLSKQSPEGLFSEYGDQQWNLAATAFATKFMGETLHYLKDGPPLNEDLLKQVAQADRKAILAVLYGADLYEQGKQFSSQYTNLWAGALAYLALNPDPEIRKTLETRLISSLNDFQSPAGYFYEAGGPDMGYNLGTHHSNIRMAWHYARGTPLEKYFLEPMKEYYVWLVWNVSLETDRRGYYLNAAINTRSAKSWLAMDEGMPYRNGLPLAEQVRLARAFQLDTTAYAEWIKTRRLELSRAWPQVPQLEVGNPEAYSPYTFLHRRHYDWRAEQALFRDAITALPCADTHPFNHVKKEPGRNALYFYANRPTGYYFAFAAGEAIRPQQSLGLTMLRSQRDGTVLLGQPGNGAFAWGTRPEGSEDVYESTRVAPSFSSGNVAVVIKDGPNSMAEGDVVLSYPLGTGTKTITLARDRIDIVIRHPGAFSEQLPLLPKDGQGIDLKSGSAAFDRFKVEFKGAKATLGGTKEIPGPRNLQMLVLEAKDTLAYSLRF
ncbi:MAG: hypothetical protein U5J83_16565 [Bryobacterales bacterium]|nr:hypothetical protein [Bryobacterales bacterium]